MGDGGEGLGVRVYRIGAHPLFSIFPSRSPIVDPQSSILNPQSSILTSPLLQDQPRLRDRPPGRSILAGALIARIGRATKSERRRTMRSQDPCELRSTRRPLPRPPLPARQAELCRAGQSRDLDRRPPANEKAS